MTAERRLRIVIASRIYQPEPSAASFMLDAIARSFHDDGYDVTVLTSRPPAGTVIDDPEGIDIRRAPVLRDRSGYLRGYLPYLSFDIPLFFRIVFGRRGDLYLVEPPPTTGAIVRVASAIRRRPYVYDAADIWADAAAMVTTNRVVLAALRAVERFALRGARRLFAVSEPVVRRLRELAIDTPATVIGFGADTRSFGVPDARIIEPTFVYAGTYSEWHGAGIFIEAFARFRIDHPGYRLVFIGNGSEREALAAMCAENGLPDVEFRDAVAPEQLSPLLGAATAALASVRPGHGYDYALATKVFSYGATGCPTIFAGAGPTAEFLTAAPVEAGMAVPYDVEEVVRAMIRYADAPRDSSARRSLSEWIDSEHSLRAIARRVTHACRELLPL